MSLMPWVESPTVGIIEAERVRGISFFGDFNGICKFDGQLQLSYTIRYQKTAKPGTISCPITTIDASQLLKEQRDHLRTLLSIERNKLSDHLIDNLCTHGIVREREDIFNVLPKDR